jgi:SAM-dependent methyltransferase
MQSVQDHYAKHLSAVYSWMSGGVEAALLRGSAELDALHVHSKGSGQAVDLGAGFGMHSIPLARRGYTVLAVDSSCELLREMATHAAMLPIQTVHGDLLKFREHVKTKPELILCMGDTLAHLASVQAIESLIADVAVALGDSGVFVLTFRDYSAALTAERRFIPVRSDADRILTCFLEYEDAHVTVHDLLNEREGAHWGLRVSSYRKLRLVPEWVCGALTARGFVVTREPGQSGMVRLVARMAAGQ